MTKNCLRANGNLALVSLALIMCCSTFASPTYKSATAPAETSLQGWDGNISLCSDKNLTACWNSTSFTPYSENKIWYPVAQLGAGLVITSTVGQSQSFPIQNPNTDEFYIYNAQKPSQSGALFEIFLGSEWVFRPRWALQTGVDFDQVYTNYNANGIFTQGADAQSANQFSYNYSAIVRQVLAEVKLLYSYQRRFHPYLLLGLGAAFNTAYSYNTSVPPFLTFTRQFSDNTNTAFTYAAGFGIDLDISEEIRLGIGYRFSDLGKIELGPASINNTTVSGTLSQSHMYSNILLTQVTFVF